VRIIAVDWSGAKRGAGKKIWAAEFCDDQPVKELVTGKDRAGIKDYLVEASLKTSEIVVGLDFAFSFPSWFVELHANSVHELWSKVAEQGEAWLSECNPPFWGRKNVGRCDLSGKPHYRRTEKEIGRINEISAKSVFQINGGGTVGTGSIRGMAILHEISSHFRIWPFGEAGWPKIIEIWPRALTGGVRKSDKQARRRYLSEGYRWIPSCWQREAEDSEDAFDAVVSACVMQEHKDALSRLETTTDPVARLEGMIWCPRFSDYSS
jgi:hypothetical protein